MYHSHGTSHSQVLPGPFYVHNYCVLSARSATGTRALLPKIQPQGSQASPSAAKIEHPRQTGKTNQYAGCVPAVGGTNERLLRIYDLGCRGSALFADHGKESGVDEVRDTQRCQAAYLNPVR